MFENVRASLRELLAAARSPADRRAVLADMKETLVRARMGVEDVRGGLAESRRRLDAERRELETVRRRRDLASRIGDQETVAVAERFERQHAEHVEVLAGALGSPLEMTLGLATVVVHLFGVLVVGECVISAAMLWIADRLTRR